MGKKIFAYIERVSRVVSISLEVMEQLMIIIMIQSLYLMITPVKMIATFNLSLETEPFLVIVDLLPRSPKIVAGKQWTVKKFVTNVPKRVVYQNVSAKIEPPHSNSISMGKL